MQLLKGNSKGRVTWTSDLQDAMDSIKSAINEEAMLHLPWNDLPFILYTDASEVGMGGALMQEIDGLEVPVKLINKEFSKSEKKLRYD